MLGTVAGIGAVIDTSSFGDPDREFVHAVNSLDVGLESRNISVGGVIEEANEVWRAASLDDSGHETKKPVSLCETCMCRGWATHTLPDRLDYIGPVLSSDAESAGAAELSGLFQPTTSLLELEARAEYYGLLLNIATRWTPAGVVPIKEFSCGLSDQS